jgi:hypothetical protein
MNQKMRFTGRALAPVGVTAFALAAFGADNQPAGQPTPPVLPTPPSAAVQPSPPAVNTTSVQPGNAAINSSTTTDTLPKIRWSERPATDTRDGRVEVNGVRISMPRNPDGSAAYVAPAAPASGTPVQPSDPTLIPVPDNTIGPGPFNGESLQQHNDRISNEIRLGKAMADLAEQRVEQEARYGSRWGATVIRSPHGGGFWHGGYGPYGPVTTSTRTFDDLGSSAQRAYSEAAYPRIGAIEEGRAGAARRFGADATPRIIQSQRDRDEAVIRANREQKPK